MLVRQRWIEIAEQEAIAVHLAEPTSDGVGVLLVLRPTTFGVAVAYQRGVYLHDHRSFFRHRPAVKRPEVNLWTHRLLNSAKPRQSGMGGLRHAAVHVEEEHRLRRGSPLLREPDVCGRADAVRPLLTNEVNVRVVGIRGPGSPAA